MKWKVRIYAMFQFFSFASLLFLILSISLGLSYFNKEVEPLTKTNWVKYIKGVFRFSYTKDTVGLISTIGVLLYLVTAIISWVIGWSVFTTPDRNYYDELFLMFLVIPFLSNIFALMAQLSFKINLYKSGRISSEELQTAVKEIKQDIMKAKKL